MSRPANATVADIVARFFQTRRRGQRPSIDQVLDSVGPLADRSAVRAAALRAIATRVRSAPPDERRSCAAPAGGADTLAALPELPGYDVIDCVGRGGMGIVYEAYQQATGRRVAIKFMLETAAGETARRRFEREVDLVARLQHPHVVSVLDSGAQRGRYFYVMEYIDGRPLDQAVCCGQCNVPGTLHLVRAICEAVDYAHQRGVLHRDLKPSNILIDERGDPHVLDFGLAKAIDPAADGGLERTLSEPGQLLGTLAYMSPEQSRGDYAQMSVRSDVYSLGALAYELLTGSLPCGVDGPLADVLGRIAEHDPPAPSRLRRDLPADLGAVLLKAVAKRPRGRYASAGALADDLGRVLSGHPVAARRQSRMYVLRKTISRHRAWFAVGALGLATLVVVAIGASIVATQRRAIISALEEQVRQREARLAAADARRAALTHYYEALDYIRRGVKRDDALALLNRALEIDPSFAAAFLERGLLCAPGRLFSQRHVRRAPFVPAVRAILADFDRAHESAGGDWLVDPATGRRLTPAAARALPTDEDGRLRALPDVLRLADGSLVRVAAGGGQTPVGGPGLPRALMAAGNLLAMRLRQAPTGYWMDAALAQEMDRYYQRAAALDPANVYTRLSRALAAAAKPAQQAEAAGLLAALADDSQATVLVEFWQARAEVRLGGPRRSYPEVRAQRDPVAAEQAARQVTALAPHDVYGWYMLGLALQEQGRHRDAIRVNEQALTVRQQATPAGRAGYVAIPADLDAFGGPVLTNLATCHAALGDFEAAWPLYQEALEESGGSLIVLLERAEAYQRAGMAPQARADLDSATTQLLKAAKPLPALAIPVSWALLTFPAPELRDAPAAREILTRLRKRDLYRRDPTALMLLGCALTQCGEPEAALELAAQWPPSSGPSPFRDAVTAAALKGVGRSQAARDCLERAEQASRALAYGDPRLECLLEQVRLVVAEQ